MRCVSKADAPRVPANCVFSHTACTVRFPQVKRAIGTLLVDENRALFDEATALAEILGDVQLKTSALLQRRQLCSNPERNMASGTPRIPTAHPVTSRHWDSCPDPAH